MKNLLFVDDQLVSKTVNTSASLSAGGVIEKYIIDRNQIAYVTDGSGTQTFHYLYGNNIDSVMAQDSPTGMVWSLSDRLGSVNLLTDAGGVVVDKRTFDSFGRVLSETNPGLSFRYGYTGRETDGETGLDYYRARYYDAANGRFISTDPMGFGAGDSNLYRYVGNSSTLYTDPSGEIVPLLAFGLLIAAGGLLGAGYGVANHLDNGGSLDNIDLQDIWEKATIGAFTGGASFVFGAAASATAAWAGVAQSTIQAGGLIVGAAFTGWQAGTGINNIQNGKPYTGALDLVSAGLGAGSLFKGYQGYRQTLTNENLTRMGVVSDIPGNPRPISQEYPQVNSSGEIVRTSSSGLATRTAVGDTIVPYGNPLILAPAPLEFNPNLYNHLTIVEGLDQQKGVLGGHTRQAFYEYANNTRVIPNGENQLVNNVRIDREISHPTIQGLSQINYSILKGRKLGGFENQYKSIKDPKTVWDSNVISDSYIIELGKQAAAKSYHANRAAKKFTYTEEAGGIHFRVHKDETTGVVRNVHPVIPELK
jgi:RHS repeat-associated protein